MFVRCCATVSPHIEAVLWPDIHERPVNITKKRKLDLYTSGFPCQSFSGEGNGQGIACATGQVALAVVNYIVDAKPTTFMLENVAALVQPRHADDFDSIMSVLHATPDKCGRPFYRIVYKVVGPTDVGIPQSRPRLFIVGISAKHEQARKRFMFPSKGLAQPLRPLDHFLNDDVARPADVPRSDSEQNIFACPHKNNGCRFTRRCTHCR